ncbi:MAG: Fis family transcriptional regulator [Methylococcaceae bacterium]|jgi:Fis family transcriptional regulator|uniref:helix-turn-helix domain-containing protein n=1 Tax=methanotrophic endosymbiont of Bathymodiolus puteoserpentis (Logatchev) TaxID=343235 RepID=UPI00086BFF57|nr:helix-turn-helix domain-containing protein [methanotrophic endosymbiont of Bathymodiolus puteoserpentis (Logatchev)]MCF7969813.1 Fis family transcriptional regulator [Methylococcaceae bacterium]SCN47330.1 DNA-binding protein Fis [methanotrophic endosymbiont of Bathymodiolus azoricus (Menez Gwen)]SHE22939.1 DNA-binding protein Fis [methanotrophic endosymbiont of Bathymodiolus puteoserpentis (Logatchev)]
MSISNNTPPIPLSAQVKQAVDNYLKQLDGYDATGLHAMVLAEVEKPLFEATLQYSGYNQTKTAQILGISRSTLRKKIEQYDLS